MESHSQGRLKVALYYPWVYLYGGPERTISELLKRTRHDWTIFTNRYEPENTFPDLKQARIVEMPQVSVKRTFTQALRAALQIARQDLPWDGERVLFVFCEGLGDLVAMRRQPVPLACLCFTPLRIAFDPHYRDRYLQQNSGRWWREPFVKAASVAFRLADGFLWRRYRKVIAISSEVKQRIAAHGLYPSGQIDLAYPGVDIARLTPSGASGTDFFIPGRIMWTKNLELAIDAFLLLRKRRPEFSHFTLTMAGFVDRKSEVYLKQLQERAAGCDAIRFLVSPSDDELFGLLDRCYAVLYPPFNEDWGLAPIEAMAMRKPVIATHRGGPAESIVDGQTGYLVPPTPEAFADKMELLAGDPALVRRLGEAARERAKEFDWAEFARRIDDAAEQLAGVVSRPDMAEAQCA